MYLYMLCVVLRLKGPFYKVPRDALRMIDPKRSKRGKRKSGLNGWATRIHLGRNSFQLPILLFFSYARGKIPVNIYVQQKASSCLFLHIHSGTYIFLGHVHFTVDQNVLMVSSNQPKTNKIFVRISALTSKKRSNLKKITFLYTPNWMILL